MKLEHAVDLIKPGFPGRHANEVWADLGSGHGLFTSALAQVLGQGSVIHAVDRSPQQIPSSFNDNSIVFHHLDFVNDVLSLGTLNGILMANSLHFVEEKCKLLLKLRNYLRQNGHLIVIEYELDVGNQWVPYPIPYTALGELLKQTGFKDINRIGEYQSRYGERKMYTCIATNS